MADLPPDWAIERVLAEYAVQHPTRWTIATIKGTPRATEGFCTVVLNYARYIAEHEERPLDPMRAEAVELVVSESITRTDNQIAAIRNGQADRDKVDLALRALRRGISLSQGTHHV